MYFADLFCGAGGFTQGLKAAGLKHAVGVEWDKVAAVTYAANHGHVIVEDVTKVTGDDIRAFLPKGKTLKLLAASPPCQSFSAAAVDRRKPNDPKDALYLQVIRLARELKPDHVIIENVAGIMSKLTANGTVIGENMLRGLRRAGYTPSVHIVIATDYEVPQLRKRAIITASRPGVAPLTFPLPIEGYDASIKKCLEPISRIPEEAYIRDSSINRINRRIATKMFVHVQDPDKPSYTAVATHSTWRPTTVLRVPGSSRLRILTPEELACVQTFPTSYKWKGTTEQTYHQIGNAVPARLSYWLGRAVVTSTHKGRAVTQKAKRSRNTGTRKRT